MSEAATINIRFKLNFPVILIAVLIAHLLFLTAKNIDLSSRSSGHTAQSSGGEGKVFKLQDFQNIQRVPFVRTVGSRESKNKTSTYLHKGEDPTVKTVSKDLAGKGQGQNQSNIAREIKKDLSLSDLADKAPQPKVAKAPEVKPQVIRPGARPGAIPPKPKAIEAISLRGSQMHQFAQAANAMALSGDGRSNPSLSNSDILVNLEVPEGVNPDELNKYELMFYGFQRRTAINYINSFFKRLDKFQRENPHKSFPLTDTKQVMTGRLTYDEKGNIKQIKMIRWTNVDQLQNFFEGVLKDMDTLHNPPTALWEKSGEFSIFFSLVING